MKFLGFDAVEPLYEIIGFPFLSINTFCSGDDSLESSVRPYLLPIFWASIDFLKDAFIKSSNSTGVIFEPFGREPRFSSPLLVNCFFPYVFF